MKQIRIAGVPEHFNLPWHLCVEGGEFEAEGIDLQWTDVPEGTGKLCQMLREGETDMAIILTEGIIKDILQNHTQVDSNPVLHQQKHKLLAGIYHELIVLLSL